MKSVVPEGERGHIGRERSPWALVWLGSLSGLWLGGLIGVVFLSVSYLVEAATVGGNSAQLAGMFVPAAAVVGALIGLAAGLTAAAMACLGAAVGRLVDREAWGVPVGGGIGGCLAMWFLNMSVGIFSTPADLMVAAGTAVLSAVGLARIWTRGAVFARSAPRLATHRGHRSESRDQ